MTGCCNHGPNLRARESCGKYGKYLKKHANPAQASNYGLWSAHAAFWRSWSDQQNKKPLGLGFFLVLVSCCIREHRRFWDCPAEVAWSQKGNFARLGPERTYLLVSVGFIRLSHVSTHGITVSPSILADRAPARLPSLPHPPHPGPRGTTWRPGRWPASG